MGGFMRYFLSPRLIWILAVVGLAAIACSERLSPPIEDASANEIDRTLTEWAAAVEDGDAQALVALVSEDAEFWTHGAAPMTGREELENAFVAFFNQYDAVQRFQESERTVAGDIAFLRGEEVNILTPKTGGEVFEYRQRAFSVMRRGDDGRWRFWRGMTNQGPAPEGSDG
jgi:uncharacterized protein (TIGR02246 family)